MDIKYARSIDKEPIKTLNLATQKRLKEVGGNRYISTHWDVIKQDIHNYYYIRFLDIVEVPEGVEIVETIELPEIEEEPLI